MIKAPFPWFGGKSRAAPEVWARFGQVKNYVEPFFGSGAVMLAGPDSMIRTINDKDGFVANFWRAVSIAPDEVAKHADNPVSECDLHARHVWLLERREELPLRLMGDPDYFDAKIAGWWVWGQSSWIGSGWCAGTGPWGVVDGVFRKIRAGQGVNRQLPHLGDAGQGVNRQLPHLGDAGRGARADRRDALTAYINTLADKLRGVRVACGDWSRVCGPSVTHKQGITGVFLDPPYADTAKRASGLYASDCELVAHDVREWAIRNGDNHKMRIALCGYEGEHEMPASWECFAWRSKGAYKGAGGSDTNRKRERVWFSPHCLRPDEQESLL